MLKITNFIGIDMAKNDFYACLNEIDEPIKFNNNTIGIRSFLSRLKKLGFGKADSVIGVESTASYHLKLCLDTTNQGYLTKVINPLITSKQNQTELRKVKNDKKDAQLIRYCLIRGAGYEFNNDPEALILKSLVRQRDSLVRTKIKSDRQQVDISYKENCLKQEINPIYEDLSLIIREKIKEIEDRLKDYRPDEQRLLQSIPGVGPITAATFISEVEDIKRFKTPAQLAAYAGIDPRTHESGISVKGKGYITKRGNKLLRTRLYNAATVAVLHDNIFKEFFQKKRSQGKPYKVALVATMRKMTHVIHAVWTRGTPFV